MPAPTTTTVEINGFPCRVWSKGQGRKLGFLAGLGGLPRWLPFLDRLAETRTVIAPSLPGYPGGATGHTVLDTHLDWVLAVRQLIDKAGLAGADLLGASVGGCLRRRDGGDLPEPRPQARADRAVRPVRRGRARRRPLGSTPGQRGGLDVRRRRQVAGAGRRRPMGRTRSNGRSRWFAPPRPRRAPSGRSATRISRSALA